MAQELLYETSWIDVQTNTFTNWVNNALSSRALRIESLETDFEDGLVLMALIEILSGRKITQVNKRPRMRAQKAGNLSVALQHVKDDGVRLVNIGPEDILDHNKKIILGLIWALILRYQIIGIEAGSPKAILLEWVNKKIAPYPVAKVTDFKGSWADGNAITALTDAMQRGICPLDGKSGDNLGDIDRAMGIARDGLNPSIPMLMKPEYMAQAVDDLSCMTYISMFKDWEENQSERNADLKKAGNCWMDGPGLEQGVTNQPNQFTIHSVDADGNPATSGGDQFEVNITGPVSPETSIRDNNDGTYTVEYVTPEVGVYDVAVSYKDFPIRDSPRQVQVASSIDPSQCWAEGRGLEGGVVEQEPTDFLVYTAGGDGHPLTEGDNDIEVRVRSPNNAPCDVAVEDRGDGTYAVSYCADEPGDYEIDVLAGGQHIRGSTFRVHVAQQIRPDMVTGIFTYTVQAKDYSGKPITHGGADWKVVIQGPGGASIDVKTQDHKNGEYSAQYELAAQEGADSEFEVSCTLDGKNVGNSPFTVRLGPKPTLAQRAANIFKGITGKGSARTVGSSSTQMNGR